MQFVATDVTARTVSPLELLSPEVVKEANRQFSICNACRYCEGICAVFPALERRIAFDESDITFLANLCHDCRGCFDACPYATPHVFAVDIPPLMSLIREQTYEGLTAPRPMARLAKGRASALLMCLSVLVVVVAPLLALGPARFFSVYDNSRSFYEIVPFLAIVIPGLAIAALGLLAMLIGGRRFVAVIEKSAVRTKGRDLPRAVMDILLFRNMAGGGAGCNYPQEELGESRRVAHSLMFYGFGLALLSTAVAAVYQDLLHIDPPYDLVSVPVVLGIAGGVAMLVACLVMLSQKARSRKKLETEFMKEMDVSFILQLLAVNATGIAVLLFRSSTMMGLLLTVHLGLVLAFFVTLPYGKFVHGLYRSLALYRSAGEEAGDELG